MDSLGPCMSPLWGGTRSTDDRHDQGLGNINAKQQLWRCGLQGMDSLMKGGQVSKKFNRTERTQGVAVALYEF